MNGESVGEPRAGIRAGAGCLAFAVGPVLGLIADFRAGGLISSTWSSCMDLPWQTAYDITDDPRFDLVGDFPMLAAYCLAFPLGCLATLLVVRSRDRLTVVLAGSAVGLLALFAVFAVDLTSNLSPPRGNYLQSRCPHGVPPWWPAFLPVRDSGPPSGFEHRG